MANPIVFVECYGCIKDRQGFKIRTVQPKLPVKVSVPIENVAVIFKHGYSKTDIEVEFYCGCCKTNQKYPITEKYANYLIKYGCAEIVNDPPLRDLSDDDANALIEALSPTLDGQSPLERDLYEMLVSEHTKPSDVISLDPPGIDLS
jgi:hypothetical protein